MLCHSNSNSNSNSDSNSNYFNSQDPNFHFRDPALRETLHQLVYDEVVSAVLQVLRKLDLSSSSEAEVGVARLRWVGQD